MGQGPDMRRARAAAAVVLSPVRHPSSHDIAVAWSIRAGHAAGTSSGYLISRPDLPCFAGSQLGFFRAELLPEGSQPISAASVRPFRERPGYQDSSASSLAIRSGQDAAKPGCSSKESTSATGIQSSAMLSGSLMTGSKDSCTRTTTVV